MSDLLLRGGLIVDGDGGAPWVGDVLLRDGVIQATAPSIPVGVETRILDVDGEVVAPGFIDIHTHSDVSLLHDGRGQSKILQGVTTEVVGNCGFSAAPVAAQNRRAQRELLAGLGDDPIDVTWTSFDGYAEALEATGTAVNVAALVGHGMLRIASAGLSERLTARETTRLEDLLREALEAGAFGMSTGLTYVPSSYGSIEELEALCRILSRYGGVYATHARGEGIAPIDEVIGLGRRTGVRAQFSHLAINDPRFWGTAGEVEARFDRAESSGVDVAFDVYPYAASASALTQYLMPWVQEGGIDAMRRRLGDPASFRRAERELARGWGIRQEIPWMWERVVVSRAEGILGVADGASVRDAATEANMSPEALVLELCRQGGNRVQVVLFYRTEEDVETFLRSRLSSIGSDGAALPLALTGRMPHPRAYGAHARVLARYVRERRTLDLASAVHKMTAAVADRIGITDRGRLRAGAAADLVVFAADTVTDLATFSRPTQGPVGVSRVFVNGILAVDGGVQNGSRAGRVLRSR